MSPKPFTAFVLVLTALLLPMGVYAHQTPGAQTRDIVLVEGGGSTLIYIRSPLPLVFADEIAAAAQEGRPLASPFLYFEQTGDGARYRVDVNSIERNRDAFAERLLASLIFVGADVQPHLVDYRVATRRANSSLDTADNAQSVMEHPSTRLDPVFAEGIVEYVLRLPARPRIRAVQSGYPSIPLPEGVTIDTHLTRDVGGSVYRATHEGQMQVPVAFPERSTRDFLKPLPKGASLIFAGIGFGLAALCLSACVRRSRKSA